ncbi:MAG: DUF502 domain-containing protein [Fidelibacterota bacterium]
MSSYLKTVRGKIVAGLVTLAPIAATVWVLQFLFNFFDGMAAPVIDRIIGLHIPGLGLIVSFISIFFLGILVTNILGRKLIQVGESMLQRIPIAKSVYSTAKQITQALGGSSSRAFKRTVLIEYPRKGVWSLAFVTGKSVDQEGITYIHVFLPTTPNPTSGFMLILPEADSIDAQMTVEQGMKTIISGGMLAPEKNQIKSLEYKKASTGD